MLHLSHVLAVKSGIDNCATLMVFGLTAKSDSRVVKLTWLSKYCTKQYERVLQHIKRTPIPGVPNVLFWAEARMFNVQISTPSMYLSDTLQDRAQTVPASHVGPDLTPMTDSKRDSQRS
jgi:hypothetical protein